MSWRTVALGDVCDITGGGTPSKSNPKFYVGDIPWATVRDMNRDYLVETDFKISKEAVKESSTNIIPKNNVVIATRVGLGKVCILKQDTAINQDLRGVVPKNPKALDVNYLFFWFKSISKVIVDAGRGATVQGVTLPFIKSLQIPLPPLATQQKIVAKLDAIFAEIDKATAAAEANARNAEALFQSYLTEVFESASADWNVSELGKITNFIDYRGKTPTKTSDGIRLITAKNVKFGFLNKEPYEYIAEEDYEGWMTRGIPKKGDVLFTTEAPLANVAQLDTDEKVVFAQRLIILQPQEKLINSEFLKFSLLSRKVQNQILSKGTGATVKGIKASLLKLIQIEYPSLKSQKEICHVLADIKIESNKLKDYYTRKSSSLNLYKNSILNKAFSGELVRD